MHETRYGTNLKSHNGFAEYQNGWSYHYLRFLLQAGQCSPGSSRSVFCLIFMRTYILFPVPFVIVS